MSDCCAPGQSASNQSALRPSPAITCSQCGQPSRPVSRLTLKHQVLPQFLTVVDQGDFYFCGAAECPVVYFSDAGAVLSTQDVRRAVTQKDPVNAPVCYCFGFTPAMVREELESTGKSTVIPRIAAQMKADFCACEIRNPQGSCCLGNVKAAVKRALASVESSG